MVKVRTAKIKGSQFEYACFDSLKQALPNIRLTKQLGFVGQYDLIDEASCKIFECKRLRGISWNQLLKFYIKLKQVAPDNYSCFILFQSNHQPCLVFHQDQFLKDLCIKSFIDCFQIPFIKHEPIKRKVIE